MDDQDAKAAARARIWEFLSWLEEDFDIEAMRDSLTLGELEAAINYRDDMSETMQRLSYITEIVKAESG